MFKVEINNKMLCNEFKLDDVELLWQHMSEDAVYIELNVTERDLADWEDCDGETIYEFLENARLSGFIDDYVVERI